MKLRVLTIFLFMFNIGFSQWMWQNPIPQGNDIKTIQLIDENTIVGGAGNGSFFKSTDSGNSWERMADLPINKSFTPTHTKYENKKEPGKHNYNYKHFIEKKYSQNQLGADDIFYLQFFGLDLGYAVCGTDVFKTTDGANSWQLIKTANDDTEYFMSGYFVSPDTGWIGGAYSKIWKTVDGGLNWIEQGGQSPDAHLWSINFVDENNGWACGGFNSEVLRTKDGGTTWTTIFSGNPFFYVQFTDVNNGWLLGDNAFRSTDGGTTWNIITINLPNFNPTSGTFQDSLTGTLIGFNDLSGTNVLKTTDGGQNWIDISPVDVYPIITSISQFNNQFVIGGFYGIILKSIDMGNSWEFLTKGIVANSFYWVGFFDQQNGFAIAYAEVATTTNGGESWKIVDMGVSEYFNNGIFINDSTGWLAGENGMIVSTYDGGKNWNRTPMSISMEIYDIHFINKNYGWVSGFLNDNYNGVVFKTTNGGTSWDTLYSTLGTVLTVFLVNEQIGYTGDDQGNIRKTTDGGLTWSITNYNFDYPEINELSFSDFNHGWAVHPGGGIFATTDAGLTWFNQRDDIESGIYSVQAIDSQNVFVACLDGRVFRTTNGGIEWVEQVTGTKAHLTDICFLDINTGWIVGDNSLIKKTTNGGITSVFDNELRHNTLNEFSLSQNYPNPFNPITTINYFVNENGNVSIKIYDLLGKEVVNLVNEEKPFGSHKIQWNASNLSSGVYFYQIKTKNYLETKKMILLK